MKTEFNLLILNMFEIEKTKTEKSFVTKRSTRVSRVYHIASPFESNKNTFRKELFA